METLPRVGASVMVRHWDETQERVTIVEYSTGRVLLRFDDGVGHWWSLRELKTSLVLLN